MMTKRWWQSLTIQVSIAQGIIGILTSIVATDPSVKVIGAIGVLKSCLDAYIRIVKTYTEISNYDE